MTKIKRPATKLPLRRNTLVALTPDALTQAAGGTLTNPVTITIRRSSHPTFTEATDF